MPEAKTIPAESTSADDREVIARLREARDRVKQEMSRVVVGQHEIIESLLIGLLCRGHVLLHGVPGLGKTLMARTLARTLDMEFDPFLDYRAPSWWFWISRARLVVFDLGVLVTAGLAVVSRQTKLFVDAVARADRRHESEDEP